MSTAKPRKAKSSAGKKSGGGRGGWKNLRRRLVLGALVLLVAGITVYLARDYHVALIRSEVEAVVGSLDPQGVRLGVGDETEGRNILDSLRRVGRRSFGVLSVGDPRTVKGGLEATLRLDGESYPLILHWEEAARPKPPKRAEGLLAIVIDDLGRNVKEAEGFLDLPLTVTPAVLPYEEHAADVAHEAGRRGRGYLLHLPMEPQGYPEQNPGRGAILVGMDAEEGGILLDDALSRVPGAMGVNNHMGSRATEDPAVMEWLASALARRKLLFLDSRTTDKSAARRAVARARGRWAERDVFLDNERDLDYIEGQLAEAVRLAKEEGRAVAIGHPHPETLAALKAYAPKIEAAGVKVVGLEEVAEPLSP